MHIDCSQNCTTSLVDDATCCRSHQLMLHGTRHENLVTAVHSESAYVPSPSTSLRYAENQCKHNCVLDVLTLAAYGGCWRRQHGHKTTSLDNDMLRIPDHQSLLHLIIQTLWLMCIGTTTYVPRFQYSAQMCITPMQAQVSMIRTSSVDGEIWCRFQLIKHCIIWLDTQASWRMWTGTKCRKQMCRHQCAEVCRTSMQHTWELDVVGSHAHSLWLLTEICSENLYCCSKTG